MLKKKEIWIAITALLSILIYIIFGIEIPLFGVLALGGGLLLIDLLRKAVRFEFGADLLAGISIVVSLILDEHLAGVVIVLMLSGGEVLEQFVVAKASSSLRALMNRMPKIAQVIDGSRVREIPVEEITTDHVLVILPHQVSPVDGTVVEGTSVMDESFLTGEPYMMRKIPGSEILSGALNGESMLKVRPTSRVKDSRYSQIVSTMKRIESEKTPIRRLGDNLGAWFTPLALLIAGLAWGVSGDPLRFLAVLVIATPCPLLIAIPVCIIGAVSVAAKRGIVIRNPAALELIPKCKALLLDKTGTITFGLPSVYRIYSNNISEDELVQITASLEQYSKHPLAKAVLEESKKRKLVPLPVTSVSEKPGEGLSGVVNGKNIVVTSRKKHPVVYDEFGLECVVLVDGKLAGLFQFLDAPRPDSKPFIDHLEASHGISRVVLISGDRESEVRRVAELVGIKEVLFSQSPEDKVKQVDKEKNKTIFVGDGINDALALSRATVGVALGKRGDISAEASDCVVLDSALYRVDELLHLASRMKRVMLVSVIGGMVLSLVGMGFASFGLITPVQGALIQEGIDLFAVLNALRVAREPKRLGEIGAEG